MILVPRSIKDRKVLFCLIMGKREQCVMFESYRTVTVP
nr:MAG TPA: hypothetical protein [Caudoviricetes sp.]